MARNRERVVAEQRVEADEAGASDGASPLNPVLAGLQAAHPGSFVAETETDSTGRDRHEMATESDVTRTT